MESSKAPEGYKPQYSIILVNIILNFISYSRTIICGHNTKIGDKNHIFLSSGFVKEKYMLIAEVLPLCLV